MATKLITALGTEADKKSARVYFHFPAWPVKETRRITDDYALAEGFKTAANLAKELESHFPGHFDVQDEAPPKPKSTSTDAPVTPAQKGN